MLKDTSSPEDMVERGKYPNISNTFEVIGKPGLYVAGTIGHSLDFRKSAGGFIHGFSPLDARDKNPHIIPFPSRSVTGTSKFYRITPSGDISNGSSSDTPSTWGMSNGFAE